MSEVIKLNNLPTNGFGVGDLWYRAARIGNGVEIADCVDRKVSEIAIPEEITYGQNTYEVTTITAWAFRNCKSLKSITIPNNITSIEDSRYSGVFAGCDSLTSIIVEEGNPIYDSRNNCNAIIETRSNTLIAGCQNTTILNIIAKIGKCAFYGCESLTSITVPNGVKSIGEKAFFCCTGLTTITIPNSVESIGDCAFAGCSSLTSVSIPNSVTSIGEDAFPKHAKIIRQ